MADFRNQIRGGEFHAPVVQVGQAGNVIVHGGPDAADAEVPEWASWPDRPELSDALRDLMAAQRQVSESLPYDLLGVQQPELIAVYVQQTVLSAAPDRDQRSAPDQVTREATERVLTVSDVMNRQQHLVITGEPGAGKSTLGHLFVHELAKIWLDRTDTTPPPLAEPVLPLRIPARALTESEPWSVLLAAGAKEMFGRLLTQPVNPGLFAGRALRARWLVFIDGLDEIIEPATRRKVIEAIAHQVRQDKGHRLVITTRPLGWQELKPLAGLVETYEIRPFGTTELDEFAHAWFRKQDPVNAPQRARRFLDEVRDSRLRDLVRNPLLATIAAINKTRRPDRPLPSSRADLYGQFMEYLLHDRDVAVGLRRLRRDRPALLRLMEWLADQRTTIITALAVHRLTGETPLFEAACTWVEQHQDVIQPPAELPAGWQDDLRALLAGSGVFVRDGDGLRFLHHSFAEYLAAEQSATRIPADFPELDTWIERGRRPASQAFTLFTFVLWGRRPGNDVGTVLARLATMNADAVLLGGRLLAEGVTVTSELSETVVTRLIHLMLSVEMNGEDARQVLATLGNHPVADRVISGLRTLRERPDISIAARIQCAIALGHLSDPAESLDWLERIAAHAGISAIDYIVSGMAELPPDGVHRAERLLVSLGRRAGQDHTSAISAVRMLRDIGRMDSAASLFVELVPRLQRESVDAGSLASLSWGTLASLGEDIGCVDEAVWAARRALALPGIGQPELLAAVGVLLRLAAPDSLPQITAAIEFRDPQCVVAVARRFRDSDQPDIALRLVRGLVIDSHVLERWFPAAARLVRDMDPDFGPEFGAMVDALPLAVIAERRELLNILDPDHARRLAHKALTDPVITLNSFESLVEILLGNADDHVAGDVVAAALDRGPAYQASSAALLCESGFTTHGTELIDRVLDGDTARVGLGSAQEYRGLASALHKMGRFGEAAAVARRAFIAGVNSGSSAWWQIDMLLSMGGSERADQIVADTLSCNLPADQRLYVANRLAGEGLLDAAATLWLDVLCHHDDDTEDGIATASRLVQHGYRDAAIAAIKEALAAGDLTVPDRVGLRQLLAWVTFASPDATVADLGLHLPG